MRFRSATGGLLVSAILVTGCSATASAPAGGPALVPTAIPASLVPTGSPSSPPVEATALPSAPAPVTPEPTAAPGGVDAVERPPAAFLTSAGMPAPGAPGEEGTFVWSGLGSDAPWIDATELAGSGSGPWTVTFDPPIPAGSWTARWGKHGQGGPDRTGKVESGLGDPVRIAAPRPPGRWTLQVEVSFGQGREATWYWYLDVQP